MSAFKSHDESARLRDADSRALAIADAVSTARRGFLRTTTIAWRTDAPARCPALNEEKLR